MYVRCVYVYVWAALKMTITLMNSYARVECSISFTVPLYINNVYECARVYVCFLVCVHLWTHHRIFFDSPIQRTIHGFSCVHISLKSVWSVQVKVRFGGRTIHANHPWKWKAHTLNFVEATRTHTQKHLMSDSHMEWNQERNFEWKISNLLQIQSHSLNYPMVKDEPEKNAHK